ncbi:MAG: ABC transporter permease, partial [Chloroflexi bacterium]|nr:ABC transporter permease [Chloroflexota bacterium]
MSRELAAPKSARHSLPRIRMATASYLAFGILAAASWGYIIGAGDSGIADLFLGDTWRSVGDFLGRLAGIGLDSRPAFLTGEAWARGGLQAIDTLAMSVLAIGIAGAAVLLTFLPAARNVAFGELSGSNSWLGRPAYFLLRGAFAFSRGVPELLWAMIIVFMLSPGILPGAIALAVHNYGIVGKLGAEVVENLDPRPARALRASGANGFKML